MSNGHYRGNCAFAEGYRKINYKTKKAIERVSARNHGAGTMVGYYDEALTILAASDDLLEDLGCSYEAFLQLTGGSLRRLLREESAVLATPQRFQAIHDGQTAMLTGDGRLAPVQLCKADSVDAAGTPVWVVSVRVEWELEQLAQACETIGVGSWSMACSPEGNITQVQWSQAFRRILGYRDVFDFPNGLDAWMAILHPADSDAALGRMMAAIWDRKGQSHLNVQCRLKRGDGSWGHFQAAADISRCPDGTASGIRGVLIDIDREMNSARQEEAVLAAANSVPGSAAPAGACSRGCSEDVEHLVQKMSALVERFAVCDLEHDQYGHMAMSQNADYPFAGKYSDFVRLVTERFKTLPPLDRLNVMLSPETFRENLRTVGDVLKFEYCSLAEDDYRVATVIPLDWEKGVLTKVLCTSARVAKTKQHSEG